MADPQQLEMLKQGVDVWNRWRKDNPSVPVDLSKADLLRADLTGADLTWANLANAYLREANLTNADLANAIVSDVRFTNANLSGANLHSANLWWANFWNATLVHAILTEAELWHANLTNANLTGANLERADLTSAVLVETNLQQANLTGAVVYGVAVWNVNLEGAIQNNLIITQPTESLITVDDLEIAQFIYMLLNHQKLRNALNAVTERGVLILGRFGGGGIDLLRAIAARLRDLGYLPIIFDFERPSGRDYTETVKTLVGLARFVVVDLSGPSVPQELYATVPFFDIPFVPILEAGRHAYSMFVDLLKYPWVLKPPVEFESQAHLLEILPTRVVAVAEEKHQERQALLDQLFPKAKNS
ncbi:MAG: pentapeptide repeat-containing protein [Anaerolineae bacterium]|nr:pentapeptide repeat-containing protein [Anaerolineae bacterium]